MNEFRFHVDMIREGIVGIFQQARRNAKKVLATNAILAIILLVVSYGGNDQIFAMAFLWLGVCLLALYSMRPRQATTEPTSEQN